MPQMNPSGKHRPKERRHGQGSRPFRHRDHPRNKPFASVLSLGTDPTTGRRLRKWFYGASVKDAEDRRDEARKLLARKVPIAALDLTVKQFLTDWLAEKRVSVRASSWDRYRAHVEIRLIPSLGANLLYQLDEDTIKRARDSWKVSPAGVVTTMEVLTFALETAIPRLLTRNPAKGVARPKVEQTERRALSAEEARKVITVLAQDVHGLVVTVAMALLLRRGEALGLRWRDINWTDHEVTLTHQLRRIPPSFRLEDESPYRLVPLKSKKSKRMLSLPEIVRVALLAHKERQDAIRKAAKVWAGNDLVFCDDHGNMIPPGSVSRHVQVVLKRAGLGHIRFHELRHSGASILLDEGVDVRVLQAILGHVSLEETEGYTHVSAGLNRAAAASMDRALGGVR